MIMRKSYLSFMLNFLSFIKFYFYRFEFYYFYSLNSCIKSRTKTLQTRALLLQFKENLYRLDGRVSPIACARLNLQALLKLTL